MERERWRGVGCVNMSTHTHDMVQKMVASNIVRNFVVAEAMMKACLAAPTVWFGLVRIRVTVWFVDLVWFGLVWFGLVWFVLVRVGLVCFGLV